MQPRELANRAIGLVEEHSRWRSRCLNLLAAENVSSPTARRILASDLTHRYSEYEDHSVENRWDEGGRYVIEIEKLGQEIGRKLFSAEYAELRAISGHIAILACVLAFLDEGGLNLELSPANGGHGTADLGNRTSVVRYRTEYLPFDQKEWNIDVEEAKKLINRKKPNTVSLGASFYLFPHPVSELRDSVHDNGGKLLYDGSHVMGLIAAKAWPNALGLGSDVLSGSTHKSLAGSQKGIILTNSKQDWEKIAKVLYPALTTNHHLMDVASLVYTMAEYLEFGNELAPQIVRNAKALGEALSNQGFDVIASEKGFTSSHQILVKTEKIMPGNSAAKALDKANIICNKMELEGANGLRLGTSEVTRLGMKESEMLETARLIRKVLIDRENPEEVSSEIRDLTMNYQKIRYSFDDGKDAYGYPP